MKITISAFVLLSFFYFSCKSQPTDNKIVIEKEKKNGLIIDSAIKKQVASKYEPNDIYSKIDVEIFENEVKQDRILHSGEAIPHYAMYFYNKDSLTILLNNGMGGSFGLSIDKGRNSCKVSHVFSIEDGGDIYRLNSNSPYKAGLTVPCKFYLILDKKEYQDHDPVYGYIESMSDDFLEKTSTGDKRNKVGYKGYFKAMQLYRK